MKIKEIHLFIKGEGPFLGGSGWWHVNHRELCFQMNAPQGQGARERELQGLALTPTNAQSATRKQPRGTQEEA